MCVVCLHYQHSFLMFYIILLFSFYVFLFYFLERKTEKRSKKKDTKKIKRVKSRIKVSIGKPFFLVQLFFPPDYNLGFSCFCKRR